ncbi:hypothetical protein MCHI_002555, partial [Candidatus Magnetoovum chiemensis]
MRMKVSVEDLVVGMYIDGFDENYLKTPFWTNKFIIKNETTIKKIKEAGFKDVYIDPAKSRVNVKQYISDRPLEETKRNDKIETKTSKEVLSKYYKTLNNYFQIDKKTLE